MPNRYRRPPLAVAIVLCLMASSVTAQEHPQAFARLEARLARLALNAASATRTRELARAHKDIWSLERALSSPADAPARGDRRRLALLSHRLRRLAQDGRDVRSFTATAGTGSISGVVTAEGTGAPLANARVLVFSMQHPFRFAITDAIGSYRVDALVPDDYFLLTDNREGYLEEAYKDLSCPLRDCDLFGQGTPVHVTDGGTASGIDFALTLGGRIAGRITDAATGAPIAGAFVDIRRQPDTGGGTGAISDADGRYVSASGLPSGSYLASVDAAGYMLELFDDIPCSVASGCDFPSGTPIAVTVGAVTGGIDFALDKGGSISGRVVGSDTGGGIPGVYVYIFDTVRTDLVAQGYTDADGRYRSFEGLPTGTYWLRVFAGDAGYLDEGYDNVPCDNRCSIPLGVTAVPVSIGIETTGIDFVLDRGGTIAGRVTDGTTGAPLAGVAVEAVTTTLHPFYESFGFTDEAGFYRVEALGTGTYRAHVGGGDGYLGEVWQELECFAESCRSLSGTPIAVQAGMTVAGIHFTPVKGGSITGTIVDRQTKQPLTNVFIRVFDSAGRPVAIFSSAPTDAEGAYRLDGLPSAPFFVLAAEGSSYFTNTYVDEVYGGVPCPGGECDVTRGRLVRVTVGEETGGIDFRLDRGGKIAGRVTDAATGEPLFFATVSVFDAQTLRFLDGTVTDAAGFYVSREALPKRSYFVVVSSFAHQAELYDDVPCVDFCNASLGTRVKVKPPAVTDGIEFALDPLP